MGEHSGISSDFWQQSFWPTISYRQQGYAALLRREWCRWWQGSRQILLAGLTGLGMGVFLVASAYLFLVQLAEYGWQ